MGNSLRCCLACMLPSGALDAIRIVHLHGHVEEISHPITAREVLQVNPDHVLSNPCTEEGVARRILVLSPDTELKRGTIYFLIPADSDLKKGTSPKSRPEFPSSVSRHHVKSTQGKPLSEDHRRTGHLRKRRKERTRRLGRVVLWRPNLECISED